jgi:hypothetical protein
MFGYSSATASTTNRSSVLRAMRDLSRFTINDLVVRTGLEASIVHSIVNELQDRLEQVGEREFGNGRVPDIEYSVKPSIHDNSVDARRSIVIVAPCGAGKTTLLTHLALSRLRHYSPISFDLDKTVASSLGGETSWYPTFDCPPSDDRTSGRLKNINECLRDALRFTNNWRRHSCPAALSKAIDALQRAFLCTSHADEFWKVSVSPSRPGDGPLDCIFDTIGALIQDALVCGRDERTMPSGHHCACCCGCCSECRHSHFHVHLHSDWHWYGHLFFAFRESNLRESNLASLIQKALSVASEVSKMQDSRAYSWGLTSFAFTNRPSTAALDTIAMLADMAIADAERWTATNSAQWLYRYCFSSSGDDMASELRDGLKAIQLALKVLRSPMHWRSFDYDYGTPQALRAASARLQQALRCFDRATDLQYWRNAFDSHFNKPAGRAAARRLQAIIWMIRRALDTFSWRSDCGSFGEWAESDEFLPGLPSYSISIGELNRIAASLEVVVAYERRRHDWSWDYELGLWSRYRWFSWGSTVDSLQSAIGSINRITAAHVVENAWRYRTARQSISCGGAQSARTFAQLLCDARTYVTRVISDKGYDRDVTSIEDSAENANMMRLQRISKSLQEAIRQAEMSVCMMETRDIVALFDRACYGNGRWAAMNTILGNAIRQLEEKKAELLSDLHVAWWWIGHSKMESVYTILSLLQKAVSFMGSPDVLHKRRHGSYLDLLDCLPMGTERLADVMADLRHAVDLAERLLNADSLSEMSRRPWQSVQRGDSPAAKTESRISDLLREARSWGNQVLAAFVLSTRGETSWRSAELGVWEEWLGFRGPIQIPGARYASGVKSNVSRRLNALGSANRYLRRSAVERCDDSSVLQGGCSALPMSGFRRVGEMLRSASLSPHLYFYFDALDDCWKPSGDEPPVGPRNVFGKLAGIAEGECAVGRCDDSSVLQGGCSALPMSPIRREGEMLRLASLRPGVCFHFDALDGCWEPDDDELSVGQRNVFGRLAGLTEGHCINVVQEEPAAFLSSPVSMGSNRRRTEGKNFRSQHIEIRPHVSSRRKLVDPELLLARTGDVERNHDAR